MLKEEVEIIERAATATGWHLYEINLEVLATGEVFNFYAFSLNGDRLRARIPTDLFSILGIKGMSSDQLASEVPQKVVPFI